MYINAEMSWMERKYRVLVLKGLGIQLRTGKNMPIQNRHPISRKLDVIAVLCQMCITSLANLITHLEAFSSQSDLA